MFLRVNAGLIDDQSVTVLVLIERLCNQATTVFGKPIAINSLTIHR